MFLNQLIIINAIFFVGFDGLVSNTTNILKSMLCLELMLLSVSLNFILFSVYLDDMTGQIFALLILTVAAAESALGLAILILYYRINGNITLLSTDIILKN